MPDRLSSTRSQGLSCPTTALLIHRFKGQDVTVDDAAAVPENAPGHIDADTLAPGIALLRITSTSRLNAFSSAMRRELIAALQSYDADDAVGAVVLTGAGDRAFSAGQDLTEAQSMDGARARSWVDEWCAVYAAILNLSTPVVAALNGYAVGAGLQTALSCDVRIASAAAKGGMPEIHDAIPCVTGAWSMSGLIHDGRITDLVQTGRMLSAQEMLDWGLVTYLAAPEDLLAKAGQIAERMAASSRRVFALNKAFLRRDRLARLGPAGEAAKTAHADAFASGEPARAMTSFLAKTGARRPVTPEHVL
jgi:enoyl-CoA hydratase/carnithine racemase